jgi:uncharacterized protein related to proFAR isomerase
MNDHARDMLRRIEATRREDRRVTVTLDAETVRLVEKWRLENLATTVRFMLRVADEQLAGLKRSPGAAAERTG